MNSQLVYGALFLGAMSVCSNALSHPTIYPANKQGLEAVTNKTNSNLVGDSVDPNLVWVMPPLSGYAVSEKMHTPNANLGFCREISDLQSYSANMTKQMSILDGKIDKKLGELETLNEQAAEAKAAAANILAEKGLSEINDINQRIDVIEARLTELYDKLSACSESCKPIQSEIRDLQEEKKMKSQRKAELSKGHTQSIAKYNQAKAHADELQAKADDSLNSYNKIREQLENAHKSYFSMYSKYGSLEGGYANIQFQSNWETNTQALRDANPSYRFEMIPTTDAKVMANFVSVKDLASLPSVLSFDVNGIKAEGQIELPSYPSLLSGNLRLSTLGACPMLHPEWFDIDTSKIDEGFKFGLTIMYNFPSVYRTKVKFQYNLYKFYQKVVENSSSGGFFWTSSSTSTSITDNLTEGFTADWTEEDPNNITSEEDKRRIEAEVKIELLKRLVAYANPSAISQNLILNVPAAPQSGAVVIADSLQNTCGSFNVYCAAGSLILRGLSSIFGGSNASASFTEIQNKQLSEVWSRETVRKTPWVSVYSAK